MTDFRWVNADDSSLPDLDLAIEGQSQGSLVTWQVHTGDGRFIFDYAAILSRTRENPSEMLWFISGDGKYYGGVTSFRHHEFVQILEHTDVRYVWISKGWTEYQKAPR